MSTECALLEVEITIGKHLQEVALLLISWRSCKHCFCNSQCCISIAIDNSLFCMGAVKVCDILKGPPSEEQKRYTAGYKKDKLVNQDLGV